MTPPSLEFAVMGPVGLTGIGAMLVLLGEVVLSRMHTFMSRAVTPSFIGALLASIAVFFLGIAAALAYQQAGWPAPVVFNPDNPMFQADRFSGILTFLIAGASILVCTLAVTYLDELRINHGEFYALVLFATAGMMLLVAAVDMLAVYLGLELMSIPIYVLAGFDRTRLRSNESALKYFLIGAFASALLLYGVALLYGVSGATSFEAIRAGFDPENPLALAGLGLVLVGFAFKIAAVPFHQWAPDVYEGAPSVVTAFMSVAVKVAAFAALLRIVVLAFEPLGDLLIGLLSTLAVLTLLVGNLMAVIQQNIKRLLAYSSIAHAGYLLIGFVPGTAEGYSAVVFYLFAYVFMNLGAFAVVVALAQEGRDCERMASFSGLASAHPGLAALMTLFMVSLVGIPGTAGFMGKWLVFKSAVNAGQVPLVIFAVLMTVVSVYYYLRIPVLMYMRDPEDERAQLDPTAAEYAVLAICAVAVVYLGLFADGSLGRYAPAVLEWSRGGIEQLMGS